jgi:hypothetical protein
VQTSSLYKVLRFFVVYASRDGATISGSSLVTAAKREKKHTQFFAHSAAWQRATRHTTNTPVDGSVEPLFTGLYSVLVGVVVAIMVCTR